MLKLFKTILKAGEPTVKYPFKPLDVVRLSWQTGIRSRTMHRLWSLHRRLPC